MPLAAESKWIDDFADPLILPSVSNDTWKANLSSYVTLEVAGMGLANASIPPVFTFNSATFLSGLGDYDANDNPIGVTSMADSFQAAINASQMVVAPGTAIGVVSNATKFSVVTSTLPVSSSVSSAKNIILELEEAEATSDASKSEMPKKLYEAFSTLQYTIVGSDSTPPPAGPLPLTVTVAVA